MPMPPSNPKKAVLNAVQNFRVLGREVVTNGDIADKTGLKVASVAQILTRMPDVEDLGGVASARQWRIKPVSQEGADGEHPEG